MFAGDGTTPIVHTLVKFSVLLGGGLVATTNNGSPVPIREVSIRTGVDGTAQVYFQQPPFCGIASQIRVTAGVAQATMHSASLAAPGDTDGDNLPDAWELTYFGNLGQDGAADFDGDGVTNLEEFLAGTDPTKAPAANSADTVKLSIWTPLH